MKGIDEEGVRVRELCGCTFTVVVWDDASGLHLLRDTIILTVLQKITTMFSIFHFIDTRLLISYLIYVLLQYQTLLEDWMLSSF